MRYGWGKLRLWSLMLLLLLEQVRLLLLLLVLLVVNKMLLTLRITSVRVQRAGEILVAGVVSRIWLNGRGHLVVSL